MDLLGKNPKLTYVQQRNKLIYEDVQRITDPLQLNTSLDGKLVEKYKLNLLSLEKNRAKADTSEFTLRRGREPRGVTVSSANAQCLRLTLSIPYKGSAELADYALRLADNDFTELYGGVIIAKAYNRLIQRNDEEAQIRLQQSIETIEKYFADANSEADVFNEQLEAYVEQVVSKRRVIIVK